VECGDIDGDAYDDVIIGAYSTPGLDSSRFESGEVYVYFGRPTGDFRRVYDVRLGSPDIRILGPSETSHLTGGWFDGFTDNNDAIIKGLEVGDVNGDGLADILCGAVWEDNPLSGVDLAGAVYVVLGKERCRLPSVIDCNMETDAVHPDIVLYGADETDKLGFALATPDLDGDGIEDLLATAYGGDGQGNSGVSGGDVYGFWGRAEWAQTYDLASDEFDFAIEGPSDPAHAGYRMTAGDLDGDGAEDLVIGSIVTMDRSVLPDDRNGPGEYRILFGKPRWEWPRWTDLVPETDVILIGAHTADMISGSGRYRFGFSMATGDRNDDGMEDLLIGVGGGDGPTETREDAGEAYLILGRPRSEWNSLNDLRTFYDLIIYGAQGSNPPNEGLGIPQDALGWASTMGDFDGNGKDEIVVASMFADGPKNFRPDCGEVHVIFDEDSTDFVAEPPIHPGPPEVTLLPNSPNPFEGSTAFSFTAPEGCLASLTIYDARGAFVATLLEEVRMDCHERTVRWNGTNDLGRTLPAGIYFLRLEAEGWVETRKITLVR
jgi:hypothetical protein